MRLTRTMHERWETLGPETLDSIRDARSRTARGGQRPRCRIDSVMSAAEKPAEKRPCRGLLARGRQRHGFLPRCQGQASERPLNLGRKPESGMFTLKSQLASEVAHIRLLHPDVRIVAIARRRRRQLDLPGPCRPKPAVIDFWHACDHLRSASDHAVASDWFSRNRDCSASGPCAVDQGDPVFAPPS